MDGYFNHKTTIDIYLVGNFQLVFRKILLWERGPRDEMGEGEGRRPRDRMGEGGSPTF